MFVWRAIKGRIPTATKLRERGVPVPTGICRMCDREEETPDHVLVKCKVAETVWDQIGTWVTASTTTKLATLDEVFNSLNEFNWPKVKKKVRTCNFPS
ncbi:putative reverse transcriptase zinc-binding domain-containing protein [Helianthus annuus]|nr:putative reverse transcriptase zinc-binding domain-containing protein [Helianthus annuus]